MIDIPKGTTAEDEPLTWKVGVRSGKPPTALFVCSNGHYGSISSHEIAEDGRVSPSVVCTQNDCNFHEYIRLIGW